jgi:RNA polymerase sigma-70 factor (ECF subfamily)
MGKTDMLAFNSSNCGAESAATYYSAGSSGTGDSVRGSRLTELQSAARSSLERGEAGQARRLINEACELDDSVASADDWAQMRDEPNWPDAWLIAAVRLEPPDEPALDALVRRYWPRLFAHCQVLTGNHEKASDLAQDACCRVLRARHSLKPEGNFPGYLNTVATNLWRDHHRAARRAGPMAENRLASLDAPVSDQNDSAILAETLPDLNSLEASEQKLLAMDIDQALEALTPLLRDVIVSRLINGESCADIGRRYGRTEQTVSGWVRQGLREMQQRLSDAFPNLTASKRP